MSRQPTILFDAVTSLGDVLGPVAWPELLAESGENINKAGVSVIFGDLLVDSQGFVQLPAREFIAITGNVTDDDQTQWPEKGLSTKHEEFSTELVVCTSVPNRTAAQAWARAKVLVATLDGTLRDMTFGRPIIPTALAALGVHSWFVSGVNTTLLPNGDTYVATAVVTVTVRADI
jgi:hypothetical protein